ncbi:MAG: PQQ-like beta-propeller repeat protein [Gemmataceae bacterium]|nr:PQQ-like beta-propeller repeat protein [Gemmataceae bacterium]
MKATIAGRKQYVQFLQGGVVGVSAETGKLLWNYNAPSVGRANAATPIVHNDAVFAACAYGNGGGRADIVKEGDGLKAKDAYFVSAMQNHHGGMVLHDGHVFGTGNGGLLAVDFETGKVAKTVRSAGKGSGVHSQAVVTRLLPYLLD